MNNDDMFTKQNAGWSHDEDAHSQQTLGEIPGDGLIFSLFSVLYYLSAASRSLYQMICFKRLFKYVVSVREKSFSFCDIFIQTSLVIHNFHRATKKMPANHNEALRVNPFVVNGRSVDIHITTNASDWYWAVMSVMGTTMLVVLGTGLLRRPSDRIFHYILGAIAFIAMVEHYSTAANLGWVPIDVEWQRPNNPLVAGINRQIWWVRYCGWQVNPYPCCLFSKEQFSNFRHYK